jgi:hypothetical protein
MRKVLLGVLLTLGSVSIGEAGDANLDLSFGRSACW